MHSRVQRAPSTLSTVTQICRRLDLQLFSTWGAGHQAHSLALGLACLWARWSWMPLLALMVAVSWLKGPNGALLLIQCLTVLTVVQVGCKRLARRWQVERPFMLGLSPNHLRHSQRGGFPSTHATAMGAVLGHMALQLPPDHPALTGMAFIVVSTGWARVYAGAHFPLDVLAGLALGVASGTSLAAVMGWIH